MNVSFEEDEQGEKSPTLFEEAEVYFVLLRPTALHSRCRYHFASSLVGFSMEGGSCGERNAT